MNNFEKGFLFEEILLKNPVLISAIGLCPVVAICASLKAAVIMSVVTILTLVVAQTLTSLFFNKMPQWVRASLYMLVGMLVVTPAMLILGKIAPETMVAMGIYLPLLSVNPLIVRQCEREGVEASLSSSIVSALSAGLAYSIVLLIVGFIREIIGNGTIWGVEIPGITPAAAFLMPMGGFVIIAYLAALVRVYFRKLDPEFADEIAVNSRATTKRHRTMKSMLIDVEEPEESVYAMPEAEPIIIPVPTVAAEPEKAAEAPKKPKNNKSQAPKKKKPSKAKQAPKQVPTPVEEATVPVEKPTPVATVEPTSEENKPKFEFITLDLPSAEEKGEKAQNIKVEEKPEKPQQPTKQSKSKKAKNNGKKKQVKELPKEEPKKEEKKVEKAQTVKEEIKVEPKQEAQEKVKEAPKKKDDSKIVFKSEELERLMSLSLDDIINDLPSRNEKDEGGETK